MSQAAIEFEPDPKWESGDIRDRAHKWMSKHPRAMELLARFAKQAWAKDRVVGINFLAERVRWEYAIEQGDEQFKINNSYRPYISRELVNRHPELHKTMRFRRTKYER